MATTDAGTAGLTRLYADMTSIDRVLRALRADDVDVENLQARDLYDRDLDCQNLGASKMLEVIANTVAEYRSPEPTDTVLDVGCGMGGPGRFLADRFGCSVLGVDLLALRVEVAQALTKRTGLVDRVTYRVADATHLPVDDHALAQVWMLDVGIHIRNKNALFAEVARVLRPGGIFVMHDQTGPLPPEMRAVTRMAPFIAPSLPQLLRYVEAAGLRVLRWQDSSAVVVAYFRPIKARLVEQAARTHDDERRRRHEWFAAMADAYITTLSKLRGRTGILIAERTAAS